MCVGRDTLVIDAPSLERWERDYYEHLGQDAESYNMSEYDIDDMEDGGPVTQSARHHGVVAVLKFSASADSHGTIVGFTFGGSERPSEDDRMASLADQLGSLSFGADEALLRPSLAKVAAMFDHHWAGRAMPPMAVEFVERYGHSP